MKLKSGSQIVICELQFVLSRKEGYSLEWILTDNCVNLHFTKSVNGTDSGIHQYSVLEFQL